MRYLLAVRPQGLQDPNKLQIRFRAPTYTELFDKLHVYRTKHVSGGCAYQYYPEYGAPRFEVVDTFEEPGQVVKDKYWDYWVPGEPHDTLDDATTMRFKQMELE